MRTQTPTLGEMAEDYQNELMLHEHLEQQALLASYLRDSVKIAFKPGPYHVDRVYEAALALEQHAQLVAQNERLREALTDIEDASKERAFHKAALDHIADVCAAALSQATPSGK